MDDILGKEEDIMERNKTIIYKVMAAALVALSLTSCVKDDLFDTPHPDRGAVVITTEWAEALAESDIPASYFLSMDGGAARQANEKTFTYPDLLTPGEHSLLVYNEPQGLTLGGTTAKVNLLPDGTAEPMPGYLFSAEQKLAVVQDDTLRVSIPMKRRVCPITINITLSGENTGKIAKIEAELSGVAGSVDMQSGISGTENLTLHPVVGQASANTRAYTEGKVELKCRVLGINKTERQMLTVMVTMEDGYVSTVTSDLSEYLKNLNTDMNPIVLSGTVDSPQDGHFSGTIGDWEVVSGGDIDAN